MRHLMPMKRFPLAAATLFSFVGVFMGCTTARAEPIFVPIDGTNERFVAEDFGYAITATSSGGRFHVYIKLDEAAAKAFKGAKLTLRSKNKVAAECNLGFPGLPGEPHYLLFEFDPEFIDGGSLIVYSESMQDRPSTINFGGFQISVDALLRRTGGAEKPPKGKMHEQKQTKRLGDESAHVELALRHLSQKGVTVKRLAAPTVHREGDIIMLEFPEPDHGEGVYGPDFAYRVWIDPATQTVLKVLAGG